uniref:Polycystin cation channel PKD1/PKD2 domain-containing protein n=1 Tax=Alexandrium andersonii TaxID=327968 RepID=A0A7S2IEF8_9DINO
MELDPATNSLTQASIESLYQVTNLDYYNRLINLAVLVLLNALLFRYLLMYFPQLSFLTAMVSKLVKPLWYTFLFLAAAFLVFATFLYVMYSAQNNDFRNFVVAVAQSVKFAQGGASNWYELYTEYATLYTIVNLIGFIVIQLMLSNVPLAVMLSHKKEKDLRQNYSYHRFWAGEISRMGKGRGEFNPALINEKEKDGKEQGR